jgi:hypothetical protein
MRITPALCSLGLLVSLGVPASALAEDVPPPPPMEEPQGRPPQLAVEVGGSFTRMEHPAALIPKTAALTKPLDARHNAVRLSGGLHFNLVRGSNREDLWWINGVDWYFADDVQVLSFRPGLEKRFALGKRLTLGVGAFGGAAEVSLPTGLIQRNNPGDPTTGPTLGSGFSENRDRKWVFGAGGMASLHYSFGRWVYTRVQAGYTQYFNKADDFASSSTDAFSVSLSGPFAGALLGLSL